ncbi:MAG: hypothetical protein WBD44_05215 [Phycisphaerae bacterium]
MCLEYISKQATRDKFLKEVRKRGYVRVYKICSYPSWGDRIKRTGPVFGVKYKAGLRKASTGTDSGWYVYLQRPRYEFNVKVCYAKPAWLKNLGGYYCGRAATFTKLVFPNWGKGDMTIREFRRICKVEQAQHLCT